MKLRELLNGIEVLESTANLEMEIGAVAYDSRKVTSGALFVAISGFASDGNRFIPMAMEKGAAAVVTAKKPEGEVPYVLVASDRLALAMIGCNFYGHPAKSMTLIGVTGTNGKTSTTWILKQVLERITGHKAGLIGTMENRIGDEVVPTDRTTPESFELQGLFARMRDAGCRYAIMEVSSHAIALDRVGGVHFNVAAFTNLTEDHLDFHKTMEHYRRCLGGADWPEGGLPRGDDLCKIGNRPACKGCQNAVRRHPLYGGMRRKGNPHCAGDSRTVHGVQCADGAGHREGAGHRFG